VSFNVLKLIFAFLQYSPDQTYSNITILYHNEFWSFHFQCFQTTKFILLDFYQTSIENIDNCLFVSHCPRFHHQAISFSLHWWRLVFYHSHFIVHAKSTMQNNVGFDEIYIWYVHIVLDNHVQWHCTQL